MNYDPRFHNPRQALDKRAVELLSPYQQRLYNRGLQAQMIDTGFTEADRRLSSILPAACGLFAQFTMYSISAMEEYFHYLEDLQNNTGPMATMLRKLARIEDLKDSAAQGVAISHHMANANQVIDRTAPKNYLGIESIAKAFAPYLDYSVNGEINLRALTPTSQVLAEGEQVRSDPILESADEMSASHDQFHVTARGWHVVLPCPERGGSIGKMYLEGGLMSSIRYRGACVYNHLEEDYYSTTRYLLTQEELEHRLKLLFSRCGWSEETYRATCLTPDEFAHALKGMGALWQPMDFSKIQLEKNRDVEDDFGYRDQIPANNGRVNAHAVPSSLAALEYSHTQSYMEWLENPSTQVEADLIAPDAPVSFFEDEHRFFGQWKISSNDTLYVRGSFTTGTVALSRNRKFEEERHDLQPITLTDSSRYVLAQWVRRSRMTYLDEVLSWFRRTKLDPPQALLDAKNAYTQSMPKEPAA